MSFYSYQNVLLVIWCGTPTDDSITGLDHAVQRMVQSNHVPFSVIMWLAPGSRMPTTNMRSRVTKIWLDLGPKLVAISVILDGVGFWAGAVRAAINGMLMAAGRKVIVRVNATFDEMFQWLPAVHLKSTGTALSRIELSTIATRVLEQTRHESRR